MRNDRLGRSLLPERTVFGRSFLPERTFAERRTALGRTPNPRRRIAILSTSFDRIAAGCEVLPGRQDLQNALTGGRR